MSIKTGGWAIGMIDTGSEVSEWVGWGEGKSGGRARKQKNSQKTVGMGRVVVVVGICGWAGRDGIRRQIQGRNLICDRSYVFQG